MNDLSRRRFVQGTGAVFAVSALAGCGNGNGNGGGNGDGTDTGNGGGNGNGNGNGGDTDVPGEIDDHLSGANLYEGTIEDLTGQSEVTIDVGAGDGLAFDPPAARISAGTTVTWEWTGEGGGHNVASVEDYEPSYQSDIVTEAGHTFEQTFEDTGVHLYNCEPHVSVGMKGAFEIVE